MATRHNLCPNPALDVDATGWSGGADPTRTDVSGLGFDRQFAARYTLGTFIVTPNAAATPGESYTVSVSLRPQTFNINGTVWIEWLDSGLNVLSSTNQAFSATASTVTRISMTGTAPASTAFVRLVVTGEDYSVNTTDYTECLIEQSATLEDYFDGASEGASWDGTEGSSTSTLTAGSAVSGDASQTVTAGATAAGTNAAAGGAFQTVTASLTAAGAVAAVGGAAQTVTGSAEAAGVNAAAGGAESTATAAATATAANAATGSASQTVTAQATATAQVSGVEAVSTVTASALVEATVTGRGAGGGWYGLLDVLHEAAEEARAERVRVPVACPNDGEPLRNGPRGELHCPFDGWIWDG